MAETRITSGAWRGRRVDTPRGERDVRPTTSLVRKALFDILGDLVEDAVFVDLFAGTGAMGFEALSRGAARVVAVERDPALCQLMRASAERLGARTLRVVPADVPVWLRSRPADLAAAGIIFLDPPYRDDVIVTALDELGAMPPRPAAPGGRSQLVVCEHHRARRLAEEIHSLRRRREARYGTTQLTFFRREGRPPEAPPVGNPPR